MNPKIGINPPKIHTGHITHHNRNAEHDGKTVKATRGK